MKYGLHEAAFWSAPTCRRFVLADPSVSSSRKGHASLAKLKRHNKHADSAGRGGPNSDAHSGAIAGRQCLRPALLGDRQRGPGRCEVFIARASAELHDRHRENEEVYIFVKGRGQFQVDDRVIEVREGTVARVACAGVGAWRNNSSKPLHYIVIQAKAGTLASTTIADGAAVSSKVSWPD